MDNIEELNEQSTTLVTETLEEELGKANALAKSWENKYMYLAADFDNFKRNNAKKLADNEKFKNEKLIIKLLDVLDNFERSFAFSEGGLPIYTQLMKVLKDEGVEIINVEIGDKFDDTTMNAVAVVCDDVFDEGCITNVVKNGYIYNGKIIRFVDVVVNNG